MWRHTNLPPPPHDKRHVHESKIVFKDVAQNAIARNEACIRDLEKQLERQASSWNAKLASQSDAHKKQLEEALLA